ncbi:MAG: prefoldin subunit alpha [Thermoplasmata archaeon]|nr:prefoldin subunit alpha [Thermoplasmata archaeon]
MAEKNINKRDIEMELASLEFMKSQMEGIRGQIVHLQGVVLDYNGALQVLRELKKGSEREMMIPIGGMVFLKAQLKNGAKCIADQGAGTYMEVETSDGIAQINGRLEKVKGAISNLENSLSELSDRYRELTERTQRMYQEQLKTGQGPDQTF